MQIISNPCQLFWTAAFHGLSSVYAIDLEDNSLTSLEMDTFHLINWYNTIYLQNNTMSQIAPGTFVMPTDTGK